MKIDKSKNKIIEIAHLIKIPPTEIVLEELYKEFDDILDRLKHFKQIDDDNEQSLNYVIGQSNHELREDEFDDSELLTIDEVLSNAKEVKDNYITIKRVVNEN